MKELDVVEQITRRLGVTVDEIESYFVDWEGEQFPLIRFAQINQRTPEVLGSLLSNPIGTPSADEGERLRYAVLAEGAQPKVVSVYHGKRRLLW